jgi:hypothetical protein
MAAKKPRGTPKPIPPKPTPSPIECDDLLDDLASHATSPLAVAVQRQSGTVQATVTGYPSLVGVGPTPKQARHDLAAKIAAIWPLFRRLDGAVSARAKITREIPTTKWLHLAARLVKKGHSRNRAAAIVMAEIEALPASKRPKLTASTIRRNLTKIDTETL